jgi:O-acetyl-ADP-ribose deacetylase (regulator of RNase III)
VERASRIALHEIVQALSQNENLQVTVVCFDEKTLRAYQNALTELEKEG